MVPDTADVAHTEGKEEEEEDGHDNLVVEVAEGDHEAGEAEEEEEEDLDEELGTDRHDRQGEARED